MWNKVCLSKVLVLAIFATDTLGFKLSKPLSREQIYMDVLKNITHIHEILYKLLGNYKHLKTIYEERAKPENQLSEEIVLDNEHEEKDNKTKTNEKKDYDNEHEYRPVTQMIFDEEFIEESSDKSNEKIDEKKQIQPQSPDKVKTDLVNEKKPKSITSYKMKRNKNYINLTKKNLLLQNKVPNTKSHIDLSNKPDLIIVGTALRYAPNAQYTKKDAVENNDVKEHESEFSSISKIENNDSNKPILRTGYNYIDKVNDNEYQVDLNQAGNWRDSNEFSFHQSDRNNNRNQRKNKTVVVLVVNREQKNLLLRNNKYESDSEKREEELLSRIKLERKILRDAYGSACLKVAVRKCYKTLVEVRKLICMMDFKCKDSFKEKFKSHSKVGCINEFNFKGKVGNKDNKKNQSQYFESDEADNIKNILRPEYTIRSGSNINYFELCLPVMSEDMNPESLTTQKESLQNLKKKEPIHILRDHYEKECQRLSREKCERACNYAITNTCEAEKCERRNKKYFTRTCKQECKNSFDARSHSDKDEYTDTDEYSDTEDDDGTEEDDDGDSLSLE